MDLVFKRLFQGRRRCAVARRCIDALVISFSLASSSKLCAQQAIVPSAESQAAWNYNFSKADIALLDEVQRGCFNYFWNEVGRPAMLAKDKTSDSVCSIAAVSFPYDDLPSRSTTST